MSSRRIIDWSDLLSFQITSGSVRPPAADTTAAAQPISSSTSSGAALRGAATECMAMYNQARPRRPVKQEETQRCFNTAWKCQMPAVHGDPSGDQLMDRLRCSSRSPRLQMKSKRSASQDAAAQRKPHDSSSSCSACSTDYLALNFTRCNETHSAAAPKHGTRFAPDEL